MQQPLFITGNQHKADYLARMLGMPLEHRKIDLVEIQSSSPEEVVRHKVREAYEIAQRPVLVEDVSLGFAALNGLPGPFIKFFVEAPDGLEKLCRMLDGFDDRSALAVCVFGYYDGCGMHIFSRRATWQYCSTSARRQWLWLGQNILPRWLQWPDAR